jgi:hypothetical protein
MTAVERAGEVVLRRIDRSTFLRKSAAAIFGFTAAAAVQGFFPSRAFAASCTYRSQVTMCQAPGLNHYWCDTSLGYTCLTDGECPTGCSFDTGTWPNACWCTLESCWNCGTSRSYCGYYNCCDCRCPAHSNTGLCGCRSNFIKTCTCTGSPADCILCC